MEREDAETAEEALAGGLEHGGTVLAVSGDGAPLTAELGLRLHPWKDRLWIDFETRITDRQDRVATSRFEQATPGYTIYNLTAGLRLNDVWSLRAAVENLGDHSYADHLNSPNPFTGSRIPEIGRNVSLGVEIGF